MRWNGLYVILSMFMLVIFSGGCASTFEFEPHAGHPAHPDSMTAKAPEVVNPFDMEAPFLDTNNEKIKTSMMRDTTDQAEGTLQQNDGGTSRK